MENIDDKLNIYDYIKRSTIFTNKQHYVIMKNDLMNLIKILKDKYNKNNLLIKNILKCIQYKLNLLKFKKLHTFANTLKIKEQIKKNKYLYKEHYNTIGDQISLINKNLKIFSLNEKGLKTNVSLISYYQKYLKLLRCITENKEIFKKEQNKIQAIIKLKQNEINYTKEFFINNYYIDGVKSSNNFEFFLQYILTKKMLIRKKIHLKNKQNDLTKFFFKNKYLIILLENNVNNIVAINNDISKYKNYHDFYIRNTVEDTEFLQETIYQKELELNELNKKIYYLH